MAARAPFDARFGGDFDRPRGNGFGSDSMVVETVVGHAELARRGLQAALEGLVRDDWLTPDEALALVPQLMRGNALRIFG